MKYTPVIGLEVHVELNTKTKMFCRCSADYFGKAPNSQTCPTCLGLPGSVPFINQQAIEDCLKIGLALNCQVTKDSLFERKNYFYPDLPKGYQISQYRWPLSTDGSLEIKNNQNETLKIRINRVHQEEDTGKLIHQGNKTLVDYNRSSVPLVEIVTEPDFTDSISVRNFAKSLQQIIRSLGVSNADMERGDMRLEANISVRPEGQTALPDYRIELKNINSFRFMVAAIDYEIKRQAEELEAGKTLHQETRGWDEDKKETFLQRSKENANDYRYFPEPDLPKLKIDEEFLSKIELPELPAIRTARFMSEYQINQADAELLSENEAVAKYYEQVVELGSAQDLSPKQLASHLINKQKLNITDLSAEGLIAQLFSQKNNILDDDSEIEKIVKEVIAENPVWVESYKAGKTTILQAFIGAVMRKSTQKPNVEKVKVLLLALLEKA